MGLVTKQSVEMNIEEVRQLMNEAGSHVAMALDILREMDNLINPQEPTTSCNSSTDGSILTSGREP